MDEMSDQILQGAAIGVTHDCLLQLS